MERKIFYDSYGFAEEYSGTSHTEILKSFYKNRESAEEYSMRLFTQNIVLYQTLFHGIFFPIAILRETISWYLFFRTISYGRKLHYLIYSSGDILYNVYVSGRMQVKNAPYNIMYSCYADIVCQLKRQNLIFSYYGLNMCLTVIKLRTV